ncbi:hypothetical protein CHU98_g6090 [Xylaria longipes]|nr:hypothetical protein CHU98_g6090 [Xylaria longipes]
MSQTPIPPSPTLTANYKLGESHEPFPMLELYLREEPTVPERLLMAEKRDVDRDRKDAARKQINMFEQQMSKGK